MPSKNKQVLSTNHHVQKNFEYHKGNVNLAFSLFLDVKTDLKDFVELLKKATADVEQVIEENHPRK